ncbi:MAG: DcaP family trimeric outer membrane transporter [Gammaproteobacteria bacterium]|nr:DcaP family trimeric outer membrane transporter [Gammaproteobacteria bacterium]
MISSTRTALLLAAGLATFLAAPAQAEPEFKFGGYLKTVVNISDYSDGDLAPANAGRDFYIPGLIPVGGLDEGPDTDFSAKESRFNFTVTDEVGGMNIKGFFELDFQVPSQGNEVVSNSYNPRMRHAFIQFDNWTFGQTWSTFQNVGALPEVMDFIGPAESTVFVRQAQVRYTNGPWQFSLENPETTVGGVGVTDDGGLPDIVLRYNLDSIAIAAIARQLTFEDAGANFDESTTGFGISVSGKHMLGDKDDFKWMVTTGSGIGRYVGLGFSSDAYIDGTGSLEAQDVTSAFAAYRHFWTDQWRSSFVVGAIEVDNDPLVTGGGANASAQSVRFTLMYSPVKNLTIGGEFMTATRELESGVDGGLNRFIFGAKYAF